MKYFFGTKADNINNFDKFVIRKTDDETFKDIDEISDKVYEMDTKGSLPGWVSITSYTGLFLGIMIILLMLRDFKTAYHNAGWLLYVGIALILYYVIALIIGNERKKKIESDPETKELEEKAINIMNTSREGLNIPLEAIKMDFLFCLVKDKKGKEVISKKGVIDFVNLEQSLFIEDNNLCFTDNYSVIAIPLRSIQNIEFVKERIYLPYWNKEEPFNAEKYKPYKLSPYNGLITVKNYYKVYLSIEGEDYYFNIPNYDIAEFKRLINYTKD